MGRGVPATEADIKDLTLLRAPQNVSSYVDYIYQC